MTKKNFETALTRLEKITEELENGELDLETSLQKFDEGVQLVDFCSKQLTTAQAKVETLLKKNGQLETSSFIEQDRTDNEP